MNFWLKFYLVLWLFFNFFFAPKFLIFLFSANFRKFWKIQDCEYFPPTGTRFRVGAQGWKNFKIEISTKNGYFLCFFSHFLAADFRDEKKVFWHFWTLISKVQYRKSKKWIFGILTYIFVTENFHIFSLSMKIKKKKFCNGKLYNLSVNSYYIKKFRIFKFFPLFELSLTENWIILKFIKLSTQKCENACFFEI